MFFDFKMNDPLVSVVMCEHNTPLEYFLEAVESVLNQTYKNFEFIIVDDCTTTDIYSSSLLKDKRIKIIKNQTNLKLSKSRNIGIDHSKGKYIAIMDSDDICEPTRFEEQVRYLEEHPNVVVCGTWIHAFGKAEHIFKRVIDDTEYYRCCLLFNNKPAIINPSVMIRKSVLNENNIRINENLISAEDYQLWVDLSRVGDIRNVEKVLLNYRLRDGQMSEVNRTRDLSVNGWYIFSNQLKRLGMTIDSEDEKFLRLDYKRKEVSPIKYFRFLNKVIESNDISKEYNPEKLRRRVKNQWLSKVYSINNPFSLTKLFFQLPFNEKFNLIKYEFLRLNRRRIHLLENEV